MQYTLVWYALVYSFCILTSCLMEGGDKCYFPCSFRITVRAIYTTGESSDSNPIVASVAFFREEEQAKLTEAGGERGEGGKRGGEDQAEKEKTQKAGKVPEAVNDDSQSDRPQLPPSETQQTAPGEDVGGGVPDQSKPTGSVATSTADKQPHKDEIRGSISSPPEDELKHPGVPEQQLNEPSSSREHLELPSMEDPSEQGEEDREKDGKRKSSASKEEEGDSEVTESGGSGLGEDAEQGDKGEPVGEEAITEGGEDRQPSLPLATVEPEHLASDPTPPPPPSSNLEKADPSGNRELSPKGTEAPNRTGDQQSVDLSTDVPPPTPDFEIPTSHPAIPNSPITGSTPPSVAVATRDQTSSQHSPTATPTSTIVGQPEHSSIPAPPIPSPPTLPHHGALPTTDTPTDPQTHHHKAQEKKSGSDDLGQTLDSPPSSTKHELGSPGLHDDTPGTRPARDESVIVLLSPREGEVNKAFDPLAGNQSSVQLPIISHPDSGNCERGGPTTISGISPTTGTARLPQGKATDRWSAGEGAQHVPPLGASGAMASMLLSQLESDLTA